MSFWEILFNVVAVLWSPVAITIYGFVIGVALFATIMDDPSLEGGQRAALVILWVVVSILVWTFLIWWAVNGYSPIGWHYPITVEKVLR